MVVQQQQKDNDNDNDNGSFHPLLRRLNNVSCDGRENSKKVETETEGIVSSSDLLMFLLNNGSLSEETVRSAVQTIRRKQPTRKSPKKDASNEVDNTNKSNGTSGGNDKSTESISKKTPATVSTASTSTSTNTSSPTTPHSNSNPSDPTTSIDSNTRTRHVALRFFYDGATYSGLAQNIGQEKDNSVERRLFDALLKARLISSREASKYSRCGRTDRGVSAAAQVVALRLKSAFPANASMEEKGTSLLNEKDLPKNEHESRKVWTVPRAKKKNKNKTKQGNNATTSTSTSTHDSTANTNTNTNTTTAPINRVEREMKEYAYAKILNNILPPSIRILGWTPVTEDFSARFSAGSRTYRYFLCKRRMNTDAIRDGLNRLVGKHDFRNLCKMDVEKVCNFERVIHSAELCVHDVQQQNKNKTAVKNGEVCYLKIVGQAFLWHQIRCIAEVIFAIGNGVESPSIITELLDIKKHPGKPSYSLADEKPLVLHDCMYPNLQFGYSVQNLWTVSCQLEKQWEELTLAAARLRSGIESLRSCSVLKDDLIQFADSKLTDIHKKLQRRGIHRVSKTTTQTNTMDDDDDDDDDSAPALTLSTIASWADGLSWLEKRNLVPSPNSLTNTVHVPLLQRSMGPSYEEKIQNLQKSEKRRMNYEENIIKKRKTAKEDKAFYDHKIKQGGTGI